MRRDSETRCRRPGPFGGVRSLVRTIGRAAMVQAYELGLAASVVTMPASVHLVGGDARPGIRVRSDRSRPAPYRRRARCCSCTA